MSLLGARRAHRFGVNHMARRCVPPPKLTPPILSLEQKRRCIERLRKCIQRLEIFDPEKAQNRFGQSEVLTLEMRIDNALSAAFGYGTPMYLRYNSPPHARLQLAGQRAAMRKSRKKRANTFSRARNGRSPCSGRQFACLKTKYSMRDQSSGWSNLSLRRRQAKFGRSGPARGASKRRGVA
jgi:hypothetical protein